jgi:hypothetical protein
MILNEFFDKEPEAYQDLSADNSQTTLSDTRKTRLTLSQLRQLRQLNDARVVEYATKLQSIKKQYAPPAAEGGL